MVCKAPDEYDECPFAENWRINCTNCPYADGMSVGEVDFEEDPDYGGEEWR